MFDAARAVAALSALGQETRLAVFRLLIKAGPDGMPAGYIAKELAVPPSTLSVHLGQLERAGLLSSRRAERNVLYAVDFSGTRRLFAFLLKDCCEGRPEICGFAPSRAGADCATGCVDAACGPTTAGDRS